MHWAALGVYFKAISWALAIYILAKGVAKSHAGATQSPTQFVATVKTDTVNPDSTSGSYGAGEMHVNTASGDIWIRYE